MMDGKNSVTDFEELLQHTGWIRNLAAANLRDHALAEDVSQEVLVRALTGPRPSGKVLRSWLAAVTCNMARNEIRGRSRRRAREAKVARPEGNERDAEQQEMLVAVQQIAAAVKSLSPKHRSIVILRFYEERTFREISKELGITENNARVRLHRALDELRSLMGSRHGDWRTSCLTLAPVAGFPAPNMSLPTASKLAAAASLVALVATTMWWRSPEEVELQQPNIQVVANANPADRSTDTLPPGDVRRETIKAVQKGSFQYEERVGRVLHDGFPVAGAKVVLWQSGEVQKTISAADGTFQFQLHPNEDGIISAYWEGLYDTEYFEEDEPTTQVLVHLKERRAAHKDGGTVYDGITDLGIPGAHVRLFADWAGGPMDVRFSRTGLEFLTEGVTDARGNFKFPDGVPPESVVVQASANGYISSEWEGGEAVLYPGVELPVRLVNTNGEPLANIEVSVGLVNPVVQKTDSKGFIPKVSQWGSSDREEEPLAAPRGLIVRLPDGRLWEFWHGSPMDVDAHGIRITVDDTPFHVELLDTPLPEGAWVEVAGGRDGNLKWTEADDGNQWQRLVPGELATLERGWTGDIKGVRARLMPGKVPMGDFWFKNRIATIDPKLIPLEVTFEGPSFDAGGALILKVSLSSGSVKVPIVKGLARANLPYMPNYQCSVQKGPTREELIFKLPEEKWAHGFHIKPSEGSLTGHFREFENKRERVAIRVNGQLVLGGTIGRRRIEADGTVVMPFNKQGRPLLRWGRLILSGEIYQQQGGPVLTSFSSAIKSAWPGNFHRLPNGQLIWDMELASVELWVPESEQERRMEFRVGKGCVSAKVLWPNPSGWSGEVRVPPQGGWLAFRVPVGTYSFSITEPVRFGGSPSGANKLTENIYGGSNGIAFPAGEVTRVQPDGSED